MNDLITPSARFYSPQLPDDVYYEMLRLMFNHPSHVPVPPNLVSYLDDEARRRFFRDWLDAAFNFKP